MANKTVSAGSKELSTSLNTSEAIAAAFYHLRVSG